MKRQEKLGQESFLVVLFLGSPLPLERNGLIPEEFFRLKNCVITFCVTIKMSVSSKQSLAGGAAALFTFSYPVMAANKCLIFCKQATFTQRSMQLTTPIVLGQ